MQLLDLIIIMIFYTSFHTKRKSLVDLKYEIASYHIIPKKLLKVVSYFILLIELTIVTLYFLNSFFIFKTIIAGSVIILFTIATLNKKKKDGVTHCRCFGNLSLLNKYPVTRNIIIFILIIIDLVLHTFYIFPTPGLEEAVLILLIVYFIDLINITIKLRKLGNSHV
ncbi:MauE/DoxX family redox-associated membrane protein [Cytobacillus sp. Hm23]